MKDKCNSQKLTNKIPNGETIEELVETFKVFGDSTRISILYSLMDGELCVCHIAEKIDMSQSAVSHQLKILKQARLIKSRREGRTIYYVLDDEHVEEILSVVLSHIEERR